MAEVWGTEAHFELARDKLKAQLDALVTAMANEGTDPALGFAYDNHIIANLQLNAVSIEMADLLTEYLGVGGPAAVRLRYMIPYDIRVHTAYENGRIDTVKNMRLLNSITNYLNVNRDLGDNYRIDLITTLSNQQDFDDSRTRGGSLQILIEVNLEHEQA